MEDQSNGDRPCVTLYLTADAVLPRSCGPDCPSGSVGGQEPTGEIRIARLVKQLVANDYSDRQQATDALDQLGAQARTELERATHDPDPEVRLEAKELLRRLKLQELWAARWAKFISGDHPTSKLLATLAEQTGNRILTGDQYGAVSRTGAPLETPGAELLGGDGRDLPG